MTLEVNQEEAKVVVPRKIGGWLIVVALGVFIAPVRILYYILTVFPQVFSKNTWSSLSDPASELYSPLWAPFLIGECAFNIILFVASLFMVAALIGKKSAFPKIYASLAIASAIFILTDSYLMTLLMPDTPLFDTDAAKELARALVSCLIWTPYLFVSQRSKETFIK
ncbi:MAG: DUF2569 domain-containing protein [Pseudomonadota bacterium]